MSQFKTLTTQQLDWLMGWPRVSVFDGGWFEWSNDPKNPRKTGEPKKVKNITF